MNEYRAEIFSVEVTADGGQSFTICFHAQNFNRAPASNLKYDQASSEKETCM